MFFMHQDCGFSHVKMIVQQYDCWVNLVPSYLVPGFLVQVHAVVQWDSLYQLHYQHPGARELIDHFWNLEKVITLQ